MKYKHIIIIFVLASIITTLGALLKIMHWTGASELLLVGMLMEAFSGVMLIVKLATSKNDFLDK
ncbi:GldL-related protein [Flavobacterium sp.]|uniref:GldL-related protein n=1 Tax=Flavobacterium sp. TaxID=239 RepID=UPI003D6A1B70